MVKTTAQVLEDLRDDAYKKFQGMEWPSPEEEEWRRTDLSEFDFDSYTPYPEHGGADEEAETEDRAPTESNASGESTAEPDALREVDAAGYIRFSAGRMRENDTRDIRDALFVDYAQLSLDTGSDDAENAVPLSGVDGARRMLESITEASVQTIDNRIHAWHYGSFSHGVVVYIPKNTIIEKPIVLDFEEAGTKRYANPQVTVLLDSGAEATVFQRVYSRDGSEVLCNAGLNGYISDNASLTLVSLQDVGDEDAYFQHRRIRLERDARLVQFDAMFGSSISKSRTEVELAGAGSEAIVDGVYFAESNRHMDLKTVQYHRGDHTNSRAYYKGAVRGSGRSVYQGLIEVDKTGYGTDAYLSNKNLVLNDGARADSIPSLKIHTNDVKCSNGSTTGKINPEEIFYLMSRGVPKSEAENELIVAFFEDAVRVVPEALTQVLSERVQQAVWTKKSDPVSEDNR